MKADIHVVTGAQFIRAIMKHVRHLRQSRGMHRGHALTGAMNLYDLADRTGHNRTYHCQWETGVRAPNLHQALNCLEAVRQ